MSWLQIYELSVPHYEVRNGKYVFALQLQRYRANNNNNSSSNNNNNNNNSRSDDWSAPHASSTSNSTNVTSYVTALQSYSQFRTLWKELLRATKTTITTSSPLANDGRAAFARRNRQTRQRLWSHHTHQSDAPQSSSTPAAAAAAGAAIASSASLASPFGSGACLCSNACCPFTRLHWVLKSYPFPPRMVLKRNSQAVLEARRHALEQFVVAIREFFTGFPRSFLHSVDATEHCRVLDIFSTFIGFSEELRSMAISRSPLLVAAWKADMLLHREHSHTTLAPGASDAVAYYCNDNRTDSSSSLAQQQYLQHNHRRSCSSNDNNSHDSHSDVDDDVDDDSDDEDQTAPTVYIPSLQSLPEDSTAASDDAVETARALDRAQEQMSTDDGDATDDESEAIRRHEHHHLSGTLSAAAAAAKKYERGSSVYILGRQASRRTQPSLPKLQIRSAKVKTISSFLVDFRDHLLAQFRDVLDAHGTRTAGVTDDARQWELALFLAAHIGQLYAVQSMVARGTDPNMRVTDGTTPLHAASRSGHNEVVSFLITHGADVNVLDGLGMTPLLVAINHGDIDLVRLLLDNGADVNLSNVRRVSAAHVAVACQSLAILQLLLEYDAFVNTANAINGKTPLHIAAETGNYLICELLLNSGANVHQRNDSGCDAYGLAVAHGHVNVARLCRAFQSHSQRLIASREQQQQQRQSQRYTPYPHDPQPQAILEITPLRQSILRATMTMAAHSTDACCAHESVKIVAHDGHSYAVL